MDTDVNSPDFQNWGKGRKTCLYVGPGGLQKPVLLTLFIYIEFTLKNTF